MARMSDRRWRVLVVVALGVAGALLVAGVQATRTEDSGPPLVNGRPDVLEREHPRRGAEVLQQAEVGVDLAPGYEGALTIGDTEIPTDELRIVREQNQVFFSPGAGRTFEALPSGPTCATATIWRSADGRGVNDITFRWCFDVT